uniref:Putative exonuclease n=1 Tax=viral metagenome TaxID=1070528 RepID=A0A6M3K2H1_9ZZZZ
MKILIMDSSYLMYKSFFAFKNKHLTVEKNGETIRTSSIFGFIREIIKLKRLNYDFIICVFDTKPYLKKEKYESYKEGRKNNIPELNQEIDIIKAILVDLKIPCLYATGHEGEEVASALINILNNTNSVDFYTNDEDCYALISNKTKLITTNKELNIVYFEKNELKLKYNVTPKQFVEFKILTGCSTDHVKGVTGIGPKNATILINKFNTVNNIINNLNKIKKTNPKIAEKIEKAIKDNDIEKSRFLTRIENPNEIIRFSLKNRIKYTNILDYIEAYSLTKGQNRLILKNIRNKQKDLFKTIRKEIKWKTIKK